MSICIIGEDSIPYDNNDLAVRTAMQELIDEEEAAMLPNKHVMTDSEINPTPFRTIDNKPHEEAVSSPSNDLQESTSTKDNSSDDYIEEEFELISADELSLNKNT